MKGHRKISIAGRAVLVFLGLLLVLPGGARAQGAINVTINDVDTGRFPRMVA
jgi:hypothetical protein